MALIECPECGKKISDESIQCSGCGHPMKKSCPECGNTVNTEEKICPNCGFPFDNVKLTKKTVQAKKVEMAVAPGRSQIRKWIAPVVSTIAVIAIILAATVFDQPIRYTQSSGSNSSKSSYSGSYSTPAYNYEDAISVLVISDVQVTSNSSYTIATGIVTNKGTQTYKFVQVKGSFQDYTGKTYDTDSTYAVGSEGLAPGESSTFRLSVTKNYSIKKCECTVYDYSAN